MAIASGVGARIARVDDHVDLFSESAGRAVVCVAVDQVREVLDVCEAEREFVRRVRRLHPKSPKPAIVGNCQGGWAAMMLAAASPDDTGPIVINGAPMSYWGGAWSDGEGDNPMRYAGGLLGGSWLASLASDLGAGTFDAAHLVQNFENLNPANTLWDKPYHLFSNVDSEPQRFLEFERWWGGFYLMNREEIEWITQNLFVGNKLFKDKHSGGRAMFDLREIKVPIILFASMGDNITPPQQAFNWVADVYKSTDEIKARGQVIVGLLHEDIGHLGIFVSGKVAKREHTQIVHVLRSIEALAPGLYAMEISEKPGKKGEVEYEVSFREHSLEELVKRINRFKRVDEKPFEAVAKVSEFNQNAYDLFVKPWLQPLGSETSAEWQRRFHPLRSQRWMLSDINPFAWWMGPAASVVKANRKAVAADAPTRKVERALSEVAAEFQMVRAGQEMVDKLVLHVNALRRRARTGAFVHNPLSRPFKETQPLLHELAVQFARKLGASLSIAVGESEVGFLAFYLAHHFQLPRESDSQVTVQFVVPRYAPLLAGFQAAVEQAVGDRGYIGPPLTAEEVRAEAIDGDVVVTCVHLSPIPGVRTVRVSPVPTASDLTAITEAVLAVADLRRRNHVWSVLSDLIRPDHYFSDASWTDRDQVITELSRVLIDGGYAPDWFTEDVLERERLSSTAFRDQFAIPHGLQLSAQRTGIAVFVSQRPVSWGDSSVQLVMLFAFEPEERRIFRDVFDTLIGFLSSPQATASLIAAGGTHREFMACLAELMQDGSR